MLSVRAVTTGALVLFCLAGGCASTAVKEKAHGGPVNDAVKVHSVWQGTCDQTGEKPYPMILFIEARKGNAFEGMTWYPTLDNGLCTVAGQVGPEGVVTFTEKEVVHGAILSGAQYTATIKGNNLKGSYVIHLPVAGQEDKGNILLKLAD